MIHNKIHTDAYGSTRLLAVTPTQGRPESFPSKRPLPYLRTYKAGEEEGHRKKNVLAAPMGFSQAIPPHVLRHMASRDKFRGLCELDAWPHTYAMRDAFAAVCCAHDVFATRTNVSRFVAAQMRCLAS